MAGPIFIGLYLFFNKCFVLDCATKPMYMCFHDAKKTMFFLGISMKDEEQSFSYIFRASVFLRLMKHRE